MTSIIPREAISPLRARMIEDMTVRNFGAHTQSDYVRAVKKLAAFLGRSPDTATAEDLRRFQIDLVGNGVTPSTVNSTVTALRFFFSTTMDRPDRTRHLALVHQPRKIPVVLSPEEVVRLLEMTPDVKYQTAFSVAYGAGLRVSEVAALKVSDIDSDRMRLRVERGKGSKDREAMLSERLLEQLRDWWRFARPTTWLFAGQDPINHISTRQLNRVCHMAAQAARITKRVTPHTLRHSFATHLMEQGVDIRVIQVLLGHAKLETTALYTKVASNVIRDVTSPLDQLALLRRKKKEPPK
jgi:integrase/recombinase XerD